MTQLSNHLSENTTLRPRLFQVENSFSIKADEVYLIYERSLTVLRRRLAFAGRGHLCRRRRSGPRRFLRVGAPDRVTDGSPGVAANPELRLGLCRVPPGLPCFLGIHLLRDAVLPEH